MIGTGVNVDLVLHYVHLPFDATETGAMREAVEEEASTAMGSRNGNHATWMTGHLQEGRVIIAASVCALQSCLKNWPSRLLPRVAGCSAAHGTLAHWGPLQKP